MEQNLAKNCYSSINGLARHNLRLWFYREQDRGTSLNHKKLNIIARTVQFGISILQGHGAQFVATHYQTVPEVEALLSMLDTAYNESPLPAKPDPVPFKAFLLRSRIQTLRGELKDQKV